MDTEGVLQDVFQTIEHTQCDSPSDFVLVTGGVPFQGETNLATIPLNYCKYEEIEIIFVIRYRHERNN